MAEIPLLNLIDLLRAVIADFHSGKTPCPELTRTVRFKWDQIDENERITAIEDAAGLQIEDVLSVEGGGELSSAASFLAAIGALVLHEDVDSQRGLKVISDWVEENLDSGTTRRSAEISPSERRLTFKEAVTFAEAVQGIEEAHDAKAVRIGERAKLIETHAQEIEEAMSFVNQHEIPPHELLQSLKARQMGMTDEEVFVAAQKSAFLDNSVVQSYRDEGLGDHAIRIKMVTELGVEIDPLSYIEEMTHAIASEKMRRFDFSVQSLATGEFPTYEH